jgi:hypothetical protein
MEKYIITVVGYLKWIVMILEIHEKPWRSMNVD